MCHNPSSTSNRPPIPPRPDPSLYTIHSDISYTVIDHHPRQILDLYIPIESPSPSQPLSSITTPSSTDDTLLPFPVILYIHGGAFKFGDKVSPLLPLRQLLNGYAIAAINYRRSGEALFPAMIQDCKSAIRYLKSPDTSRQFNLDPNRMVVWGESAGGHAAAFCGTTSSSTFTSTVESSQQLHSTDSHSKQGMVWDVGDHLDISSSVIGVVDYYGPTDFLQMDSHLPSEWATHGLADSPESLYLGGQITRGDMREKVRMADPVTYVPGLKKREKDKVPKFFVAHGTADRIVPEFMSRWLVEALEKEGVDVEYLPVDGADHVFKGINEEQQGELDERTDGFLKKAFGR